VKKEQKTFKITLNKCFFILIDLAAITLAWFGSYWLRFSFIIPTESLDQAVKLFPWIMGIQLFFLLLLRLDRLMPHFVSLPDLIRIGFYGALATSSSTFFIFLLNHGFIGFPRSVPILNFLLLILFTGGWRLLLRLWYEYQYHNSSGKRTLIIGAGQAGEILVRDMLRHKESEFYPVAFCDDDPSKHGKLLHGVPIVGPISTIPEVITRYKIKLAILAIPSADRKLIRRIVNICNDSFIEYKILPSTSDILSGKVTVSNLREVTIEDILGRTPVPPKKHLLEACIKNKVVMVTGAGGSIGSELCRQVASLGAKRIVLFEHSEFALYKIDSELRQKNYKNLEIVPILGSVCNFKRIKTVISVLGVETIYHAAAYKHVPLIEYNPVEGIQNNLFGTLQTALAALECGVKTFLLISTDKAVRPTNIMGASKRLSEMVLQALYDHQSQKGDGNTIFTMVRFGNVLGSSGSVVPLFKKQIQQGGPVTVTHPEITRYFMTIPEAVQLVIQAGSMAKGGEIFVLDMGKPVRIVDLAKNMIKLSGLTVKDENNPYGDIEIVFTGLRPGEKLYEELLIEGDFTGTQHPMIMCVKETFVRWNQLQRTMKQLNMACHSFDVDKIRKILNKIIEGYQPQCESVDPIWIGLDHHKKNQLTKNIGKIYRVI